MRHVFWQFKQWTFLMLLTVTLGFTLSCADKNPDHENDDKITRAYKLIDAGQSDQAVTMLENMRQSNPSDEVSMALASAYAGRAGIHIASFVNFAMSFTTPEISYQSLQHPLVSIALANLSDVDQKDENTLLNDPTVKPVLQSLILIQEYLWRISLLPVLDQPTQQDDLNHALQVAETINPNNRGAALYRALLRVVYVKSVLYSQVRGQLIVFDSQKCEVQLQKIHQAVDIFLPPMYKMVNDLKQAFPSQTDKFTEHAKYLDDIQREVGKLPMTFAPNALQRSMVKQLFQNSDFWTCGK